MSVIDDVTASFATSLALAGGDVVDLSHMAEANVRRGSQAYLLARSLTAKPFGGAYLQRHLRRVWVLEQGFKVQDRSQNRFVIAFDLRKDKNKVIKGGPWYFNRAPIIMQDYDGLSSLQSINLNTLYFWVKITNIPLAFEVKETIINVASIAGRFLEFDRRLFDTTGTIRVHVAHDITKPFFLKKTIKLAPGVIEEITFFYENLIGRCRKCNLIFHEAGTCLIATPPKTKPIAASPKHMNLVNSFLGFKEPLFTNGLFKFQGTQM
ncbi:uncharacterized protein LOC133744227 [Rosa rugosa]|uniref:uncharacterized protein LOC133744227 n=1 Tax=Rosa rugosa TaxID=74645 RepID=UPI002B406732|nr:uncharacterized protein LOC133744227 [Rosa rugosa]